MDDESQISGYCGGFTHELQYLSGSVFDASQSMGADLSHYSQLPAAGSEIELQGTVDMFSWIGTHSL